MEYSYPLLRKISDFYAAQTAQATDLRLVSCQHILEPQLHMFRELIMFGFDPAKITVLGKAYSTNHEILAELRQLGVQVLQPEFSGAPFDIEHAANCDYVLSQMPQQVPCVVLDDGADLIQAFLRAGRKPIFAVEQTSSGFRSLDRVRSDITFPVFNVARSATKLVQESPFIARLSFERLQSYFSDVGMQHPSILIVGLGPIGEALREVLVENNYTVEGFDTKLGHSDLMETVRSLDPDVICGATGFPIFSAAELETMQNVKPLVLVSVSSSDREFPVSGYRTQGGVVHVDIQYRNITFLNNGFPITFAGNRYECTPMEMEKTICLLAGAVMHGVTATQIPLGIIDIPESLEKMVNS